MKTFKIFAIIIAAISLTFFSCELDRADYDETSADASTGGLMDITTRLIPYVVGNQGPYEVNFFNPPASVTTTKLDIYKQFIRKSDGALSNIALLKSVDVTEGVNSFTFEYGDLVDGLSVDGEPLPTSDSGMKIADAFVLSYVSHTSEGNAHNLVPVTNIAVGTRLAGSYDIAQGWYIHPSTAPDLAGDYTGAYVRIIESESQEADYAVYKSTTMGWGPAGGWEDPECNFFYFYVDNEPNVDGFYNVTIPKEFNGAMQTLWCSDELANCIDNPSNLPDVSCNNYVELKEDGHDVIHISYGYIRDSGTRQFDEILVKQ